MFFGLFVSLARPFTGHGQAHTARTRSFLPRFAPVLVPSLLRSRILVPDSASGSSLTSLPPCPTVPFLCASMKKWTGFSSPLVVAPRRSWVGEPFFAKRAGWKEKEKEKEKEKQTWWWQTYQGCNRFVIFIAALQIAIHLMWCYHKDAWLTNREGWNWINEHFTASIYNWNNGRFHALFTSIFSHKDFPHLAGDLLVLYYFGPSVCFALGIPAFTALFLGSGFAASFSHLLYAGCMMYKATSHQEMVQRYVRGTLGSSGALAAVFSVYACMNPFATIRFLPVPVMGAVTGSGMLVVVNWLRKNKPWRYLRKL